MLSSRFLPRPNLTSRLAIQQGRELLLLTWDFSGRVQPFQITDLTLLLQFLRLLKFLLHKLLVFGRLINKPDVFEPTTSPDLAYCQEVMCRIPNVALFLDLQTFASPCIQ